MRVHSRLVLAVAGSYKLHVKLSKARHDYKVGNFILAQRTVLDFVSHIFTTDNYRWCRSYGLTVIAELVKPASIRNATFFYWWFILLMMKTDSGTIQIIEEGSSSNA